MKILEFTPTQTQIERAKKMSQDFKLNESSFMDGARNVFAFLGEIIVGDYMEKDRWILHPEGYSPYHFDIIDDKGKKWDVKTKMTNVRPKGFYNCTIYTYLDQMCDGYIFTRCMKNFSKVWIVGKVSKDRLKKEGTRYEKGDRDDNLIMERSCIGLRINQLDEFNNESNHSKS